MNNDNAHSQALAQVASITEMVAALECDYDRLQELREEFNAWQEEDCPEVFEHAEELAELEAAAGDCEDREQAEQRISEDALSVEVRSGWHSPHEDAESPDEFRIVLCTGGPPVEIVGDLDQYSQPDRVRILYRDWGTSGELVDFDHEVVLTYCRQFYFGE